MMYACNILDPEHISYAGCSVVINKFNAYNAVM